MAIAEVFRHSATHRVHGHQPARGRRAVRPDLEGLRAIAVLGVVVYHLRASWLPGGFQGVDVFFVLSGFLITGLLLREARDTGRVDLRAFWGRRVRRLLPASALVLMATIAASALLIEPLEAARFAHDGIWVALFSVNWKFARDGTNYLADTDPSPFTHYWSLGLEEQFYLVWPLLMLALVLAAGALRVRRAFALLAAAVVLASFGLALRQTHTLQPYAYFATWSRAWQLGLGALLACGAVRLARLPRLLRLGLRWGGVGTILYGFVATPLDVVYPGAHALVPALGAAAVIAASRPEPEPVTRGDVVTAALTSRPSVLLGRYSYGWYLWHWPPLVIVPLALERPLGTSELLAVGALTLVAAVLSFHFVEHPIRSSKRLSAHRGAASLALGALLITGCAATAHESASSLATKATSSHVVVPTRTSSGAIRSTAIVPQPAAALAEDDVGPFADNCQLDVDEPGPAPECRYLKNQGAGDIVVVGDSHAAQWYPALMTLGKQYGYGLRIWAKSTCPLADIGKPLNGERSAQCDDWRENVMQRLIHGKPDLVIVAGFSARLKSLWDTRTGARVDGDAAVDAYRWGLVEELTRLRDAGLHVLVMADNPSFNQGAAPQCVSKHPKDPDKCIRPQSEVLPDRPDVQAVRQVKGVHLFDITPELCPGGRCRVVIGNYLVYRDSNHMTIEFNRSLAPQLEAAIRSAMGH